MKRLLAAGLAAAVLLGSASAQETPPSAPPSAPPGPSGPEGRPAAPFLSLAPDQLLVSNVIDLSVFDAQDNRIGEIQDLVMDGARGVRAVIIGLVSPQGGGERYLAADPAALRLVRAANGSYRAVLDATAEQVRAAPEFKYRGAWSE